MNIIYFSWFFHYFNANILPCLWRVMSYWFFAMTDMDVWGPFETCEHFGQRLDKRMPQLLSWSSTKQPQRTRYSSRTYKYIVILNVVSLFISRLCTKHFHWQSIPYFRAAHASNTASHRGQAWVPVCLQCITKIIPCLRWMTLPETLSLHNFM